MTNGNEIVAGLPPHFQEVLRLITEFWNDFDICGDPGQSTWEELELLRQQVTDCLAKQRPDVRRAERLTAKAMCLLSGIRDT